MRPAKARPSSTLLTSLRLGDVQADLPHGVLEQQAVFGLLDGIELGADQLDAVLVEHARLGQLHREVQAGLAAHGGQQRVGPLLADDLFERTRRVSGST